MVAPLIWIGLILGGIVFLFGGLPIMLATLFYSKTVITIVILVVFFKLGVFDWLLSLRR